jgi:hypothetical protein
MNVTRERLALKAGVPLRRTVLNIRRFSSSKAFVSGGTLSQCILALAFDLNQQPNEDNLLQAVW